LKALEYEFSERMKNSGLSFLVASNLKEAAEKVTKAIAA